MFQPQFVIPFGLPIHQRLDPESLDEALKLALGQRPLVEIHEVRLYAAFGEEPKGLSRLRAFLHTKDLNFHSLSACRRDA